MNRAAIIQARMGSSRLPGKVLIHLAGKPVLWHIVHRLRKAKCLDTIAVATSTSPRDDSLVAFCSSEGIPVIRGPEDNVLRRYMLAIEALQADIIVRVTGDAPLVDPETLDKMVSLLVTSGAERCVFQGGAPCIHEGFDPVTRAGAERLARELGDNPVAREHFTGYCNLHPDYLRTAYLEIPPEHQFGGARLSVDTPSDLRFQEEVHRLLKVGPGEASISDVVRLLRDTPDLLRINGAVHQKRGDERTRRVIFRCDGDTQTGLGHVVRCGALAEVLRDKHGWGISFAVASGAAAFNWLQKAMIPYHVKPDGQDEATWLHELADGLMPDVLVVDLRNSLLPHALESLRDKGIIVSIIDDTSDRRLAANHVFFPPVPQVDTLDWTQSQAEKHVGWDWVVLRPAFATVPAREAMDSRRVLVMMGGTDPAGLTWKVLDALDTIPTPLHVDIVVGSGFEGMEALETRSGVSRHKLVVHCDVRDVIPLMAGATLAIASFGMTAYELAAVGVPVVLLSLTDDHALSASIFAKGGIAISLGRHDRVTMHSLSESVQSLLDNRDALERMSKLGRELVDGKGVFRIAETLVSEVNKRRP